MGGMLNQASFARDATPTSYVGTNPAANTEWSQTVPAGALWYLKAVTVALVQGITQTPQPLLRITDGTNIILEVPGSTAAQAVSTTCQYNWLENAGGPSGQIGVTTGVHSSAPLPAGLILRPGYVISSVTVGIGANTDYGAPVFFIVQGAHT